MCYSRRPTSFIVTCILHNIRVLHESQKSTSKQFWAMIVGTGTNVGDFKNDFPSPRGGKIGQSLPLMFEIVFLFVRGHSSVDGRNDSGSCHRGWE